MIFLQIFFQKIEFEKNQIDDKKAWKITQHAKSQRLLPTWKPYRAICSIITMRSMVAWHEIEGLQVWASPEAPHCVLEQDTLYNA